MELDKNYCIDDNYKSKEEIYFQDTSNKTDEYQDKVYELFRNVVKGLDNEKTTIADIGAGSGYKLEKWFPDFDGDKIIGYDLEPTISLLKKKYPNKTWILSDFDSTPIKVNAVICADVIEHVLNPDKLMEFILKMDPEHLVISTPDRDLLVKLLGRDNSGPPKNPYHIREWGFNEFKNYISQFFNIIEHTNNEDEYNQYIYCVKK